MTLTDGLLKAKKERDAFATLSAIVAKSAFSPETTNAQRADAALGDDAEEVIRRPLNKYGLSTSSEDPNEPVPLPQYMPLYDMNPDFFGWISIEGTGIDYPVMYAPERPEYYLGHAFDGSVSGSGVPFVDSECSAEGNCFLIYGHHMRNQTMFGQLLRYADQSFYEEHPVIRFDTLYEQREYQVAAAFYSRAYGENETGVFSYYEYTDLSDRKKFDAYMTQVWAAAIYDTGIEVACGDELIVLSTCSYHTDNGRFAVVARRNNHAG